MKTPSTAPSLRILGILFLTALVGGCSDQGPGDEFLQHVERARARWNATRLDRYTFDLYRICECTPDMAGPVTVSVEGLDAIAWTYRDGGAVAADLQPSFPSVDGLLDMIEDAIRQGAWEVTARYDPETGVPVEFRIDYEQFVFDEEAYYRVVGMPRAPST